MSLTHHMVDAAPRPVAPFSHAVETDGWVIVTGQMPTDPQDDAAPLPEGVEAQTRRTCIGVTALARDACVEIDMVARRPQC